VNSGDELLSIGFYGKDNNVSPESGGFSKAASIIGYADGLVTANDMPGRLEFLTTPDGTDNAVSRMVIKNDGLVGIGTVTPDALLEVRASNASSVPYVLLVGTGTSTSLVVTTGGVVGVGTISPSTTTAFQVRADSWDKNFGIEDYSTAIMGDIHRQGTTGGEDGVVSGHFQASVDGDSPLKYLIGLYTRLERKGGTGAGTVGSAIGVYIDTPDNQVSAGIGSVTDTVGLYIATQTAMEQTNAPYAIYSEDSNARTYFAGNVGIGVSTAPVYPLVVSGASSNGGKIMVVSTGTGAGAFEAFSVKGNGEVYAGLGFVGNGSGLTFQKVNAGYYQVGGSTMLARLPGESIGIGETAGWRSTGSRNIYIGYQSGYAISSGNDNTFLGYQAGSPNTGSNNSFFGTYSGQGNMGGQYNTFLGASAGYFNIAGNENSFVGYQAGYNNKATGNSFLGYQAGTNNTTGIENTYLGYQAGRLNAAGSGNTIVGYKAASGTTASFSSSTIIGDSAGLSLTTGGENLFLGWQAGSNVNSGSHNIIIGYNNLASGPGANNELNIGGALYGNLSNGNIGIGVVNPQTRLTVEGPIATKMPGTYITGGTYTMQPIDSSLIFNNASGVVVTLEAASTYPGRILHVKSVNTGVITSAGAPNVEQLGSLAVTNSILIAGPKWAMLQSNGVNWVIMAGN